MIRAHLTAIGSEPESLGTDVDKRCRFVEFEAGFDTVCGRSAIRHLVVTSRRRHALAGPAVAGHESIPVEDAGNEDRRWRCARHAGPAQ